MRPLSRKRRTLSRVGWNPFLTCCHRCTKSQTYQTKLTKQPQPMHSSLEPASISWAGFGAGPGTQLDCRNIRCSTSQSIRRHESGDFLETNQPTPRRDWRGCGTRRLPESSPSVQDLRDEGDFDVFVPIQSNGLVPGNLPNAGHPEDQRLCKWLRCWQRDGHTWSPPRE